MIINLSPYEKDRIVPEAFGQTEMGRDLLAQDYVLKQITSSLLYPEGETGKKFWQKVYALAQEKYGTTDIPVDTFNKVWIVPEKAVVYENGKVGAAYVTESRLKVMLETDYLATSKNALPTGGHDALLGTVSPSPLPSDSGLNVKATQGDSQLLTVTENDIAKSVLREIVIPVLEKEVNEGANFAPLRQVYQSLILATWYKKKIQQSLLSAVYVDRNKTDGVNIPDLKEAEKIWGQYVEAFKKGSYDFVKEERDMFTDDVIPRKYFSGGMSIDPAQMLVFTSSLDMAMWAGQGERFIRADVQLEMSDKAQAGGNMDNGQNKPLSDVGAVQRMTRSFADLEEEYRAVFGAQQKNLFTGDAPIMASSQVQQAGKIYARMIGLADHYARGLDPDSRARQVMTSYRAHMEALQRALEEVDLMNRRVNWPHVYDRKDGRYKPVQSREYVRLREQTDAILAKWKNQTESIKVDTGAPQADPDGMYFQYLAPSGGLTRLSNRERIIQSVERIETLSREPRTGDVERERRALSRDIARISTHSVNFLLRALPDSFARILFYELIVSGGEWINGAEDIALEVMKREWPTLQNNLGFGSKKQRAPEILDAWLHNRDFWIKEDITRQLMSSPEMQALIAQTVGLQIREIFPGADRLMGGMSKETGRSGVFRATKVVQVIAGAVVLGIMGLAAYRMYQGEWPLLGRSSTVEVPGAANGPTGTASGERVSTVNEPGGADEERIRSLLASLDQEVSGLIGKTLPGTQDEDQPEAVTGQEDENKIREAKERLESAVLALDVIRQKDEQAFSKLVQEAEKFPVAEDKQTKAPEIETSWNQPSAGTLAGSAEEPSGLSGSDTNEPQWLGGIGLGFSANRQAEATHQISVDVGEHTGRWVATVQGDAPAYLAEQGFHLINPLRGQTKSSSKNLVKWSVGAKESQAWVVTAVRGNAGRELVPVPPGYAIGSVETQSPVEAVTVYYDRSNRIWYLDVRGSPGMVRMGVYPELQNIPDVGIIGEDGQVLSREAGEQLIKDRIPADIWQLVQTSRDLPVQERQKVKADILKMFFYTQNPELQNEFERGGDYIRTLFRFRAGDCDVLAFANMLTSYLLRLPAELQVGYLGSGQDFFTHKAHGWVLTPEGIEDSMGSVSALVGRDNIPGTLYQQELEYLSQRAQVSLAWEASVITATQAVRLMEEKVQNLPEQPRDPQISSAALVTGVEGRHYSELLKQVKRMRDEVAGQVANL